MIFQSYDRMDASVVGKRMVWSILFSILRIGMETSRQLQDNCIKLVKFPDMYYNINHICRIRIPITGYVCLKGICGTKIEREYRNEGK